MNSKAQPIDTVNLNSSALKTIAFATLVSGSLDAMGGIAVYDIALQKMGIIQILQYIATGAFGEEAFKMGLAGAAYGTMFHFTIAFAASALFFVAAQKLKVIGEFPIFSGLAYGGWVWVFMNFVILPNSKTTVGPFSPGVALAEYVWHMLLVGLPIAIITARHLHKETR